MSGEANKQQNTWKRVSDRVRRSLPGGGGGPDQNQASSRLKQSLMEEEDSLPPNRPICLSTSSLSMSSYLSGTTDAYTCPHIPSLAGKLCTNSFRRKLRAEGLTARAGKTTSCLGFLFQSATVNPIFYNNSKNTGGFNYGWEVIFEHLERHSKVYI